MRIVRQLGNSTIAVEDSEMPAPGSGEVLIRTAVSALCGSELKTYRGAGRPRGNMGHEAAGSVLEVGNGVGGLAKGDRVGVSAISGCGTCAECEAGRYTWCSSFRFHSNMHAQYFTVPAAACHPLPEDIDWESGVLISGDGFGVPYHTSKRIDADDRSVGSNGDTETIAVFGLGPIGLGNALLQSYLDRRVIGVDRSRARLDLGKGLGVAETVLAGDEEETVRAVLDLTAGRGVDVAIEAAGVPSTAKMCFNVVRRGGLVVFNGEQPAVELSPSDDFIRRDITAMGAWFYHFHEYDAMLRLTREGFPVRKLITDRYDIEQADHAYKKSADAQSGKVVFTYAES